MALSLELNQTIEQKIAEVDSGLYRRPGTSLNKFIDAYSSILAQTSKDSAKLIGAGFNGSNIPLYNGYLELLSLTLGERRGVSPDSQENRVVFDTQMVLAELDKKRLMVVANYIAGKLNDKTINRNLKEIAKGNGIIDTLCDDLALTAIVKKYPQLASQIRPGQFEVTEEYCDQVRKRAVDLLALKGFVVEQGVPQNFQVDRQNRLITLCMEAISDIREFANAAFFDNTKYYNDFYASPFRQQSSGSDDTSDEADPVNMAETVTA